ncbi:S-layer homology domain-containing protein [Paenibacillus sp. JX-17]|uniref:S-layer homology domain-containing protein n=1 Tax=Paenibacillus lacisoli TaxID=3064525 RepID=A0ABT9C9X6_9BACL|nr:S-layer homology domain-containing protein [Paenibacillus sp. JX-17]MDO7906063.1 S-layer homology domain-containing protein [Paenibacillus sp. JX-17]
MAAESSADLNTIVTGDYPLSPSFSPSQLDYQVSLGRSSNTQFYFAAKTEDNYQGLDGENAAALKYRLNGGDWVGIENWVSSGWLNMLPGENQIDIQVTAAGGLPVNVYTLHVYRPSPSDAQLSSLSIQEGTLSPAFSPQTKEYTVQVPYSTSSLSFRPSLLDGDSSIEVNQESVIDADKNKIRGPYPLEAGKVTSIPIKVTSKDLTQTEVYTINVQRAAPTYTIETIDNQTLSPVSVSYPRGSQELKHIAITRTGTGAISKLAASLSLGDDSPFIISQPSITSLDDNHNTADLTVRSRDNLPSGTYTDTITISADQLPPQTFQVKQVVRSVPTRITLTNDKLKENEPAQSLIGELSASGGEVDGVYTYQLVSGPGGEDNDSFRIEGNELFAAAVFDYEQKKTYTIRVQAADQWNQRYEQTLTIQVLDVNEVPVTPGPSPDKPVTSDVSGSNADKVNDAVNENVTLEIKGKAITSKYFFSTIEYSNGQAVQVITLDSTELAGLLSKDAKRISMTLKGEIPAVSVRLSGEGLRLLQDQSAVIHLETPFAAYTLPLQQLDLGPSLQELGGTLNDATLSIRLSKLSSLPARQAAVIAPIVQFHVALTDGKQSVELKKFGQYIVRTLPVSTGPMTASKATGVVILPDGTIEPVPTRFIQENGQVMAVIQSMTNSIYTVVTDDENSTFLDTEQHWAKETISEMKAKRIVTGVTSDRFAPDAAISRAEFVMMTVRALGLMEADGETSFQDVKATDWFSKSVSIANAYGLVHGYNQRDGSYFEPARYISRQEALVILQKAMLIAGQVPGEMPEAELNAILSPFKDSASFSPWGRQAAGFAVKEGLMNGSSSFARPQDAVSRAETAVLIYRMMTISGFID